MPSDDAIIIGNYIARQHRGTCTECERAPRREGVNLCGNCYERLMR